MRWTKFLTVFLLIQLVHNQLIGSKKRKKQKYKVVTPAPVCIERQESVFSVTGFLTFMVVTATAVSNIIANMDNNNNNNNNNDNNDNVNNQNQISDSNNAENMGNARMFTNSSSFLSSAICLPFFICQSVQDIKDSNFDPKARETAFISSLSASLSLSDHTCSDPLEIINIFRKSENIANCEEFSC